MLNRKSLVNADRTDPLCSYRDQFDLPLDLIYLDGNSLGALPKETPIRIDQVIRKEWGEHLINSWSENGWMDLPGVLGDKIADLVGAKRGEVVVGDSTSVNLYKALTAALSINPGRNTIVSDFQNFPTNLYIVDGVISLFGSNVELRLVETTEIVNSIDDQVAVVILTHVDYRTGAMHDMTRMTQLAHKSGALIIWDLSHSVGAMPIHLNACNVDFAVGCGYKYLNGGPGAPAFIFVAERLQEKVRTPLSGWMGHESPFKFSKQYKPAAGVNRLRCGTPTILSMVALEVGVDLMLQIDLRLVREKSLRLAECFMSLIEERCTTPGMEILTPRNPICRGSHISISHVESERILQLLNQQGVIADFRPPNIVRFGFAPLYTRYIDVWDAVDHLCVVLAKIAK